MSAGYASVPGPRLVVMSDGSELLDALRVALRSGANVERALGQQAYMKSEMPFLGLTSPQRHALLRPLLADPALRIENRTGWERSVRELWDGAEFREDRYAALALLRHRSHRSWRDPDVMPLVEHIITTGVWWDYVDEVGNVVGEVLLLDPEGEGLRMRGWASTRTCGCDARRSSASCATRAEPTPNSSRRSSSPTLATRSSLSARRSVGRCVNMPAPIRRGCGRSSTLMTNGSPD